MNLALVPNWQKALGWGTTRLAAVLLVFGALPADTQAQMLGAIGLRPTYVPVVIGIVMLVVRLLTTNPPKDAP